MLSLFPRGGEHVFLYLLVISFPWIFTDLQLSSRLETCQNILNNFILFKGYSNLYTRVGIHAGRPFRSNTLPVNGTCIDQIISNSGAYPLCIYFAESKTERFYNNARVRAAIDGRN